MVYRNNAGLVVSEMHWARKTALAVLAVGIGVAVYCMAHLRSDHAYFILGILSVNFSTAIALVFQAVARRVGR